MGKRVVFTIDKRMISKEKIFWEWFTINHKKIEEFITNREDYSIYTELTEKVKEYHNLLNPELTQDEEGFYNLIITPDGIREGVEPTTKLVYSAPEIEEWKFFRLRQPKDKFGLRINEVDVNIPDIKIVRKLDIENKSVDIIVCFKDYVEENDDFKTVGFLMLDHVVGEINVMTRIDSIDFLNWEDLKEENDTFTLLELRKEIEEKLY